MTTEGEDDDLVGVTVETGSLEYWIQRYANEFKNLPVYNEKADHDDVWCSWEGLLRLRRFVVHEKPLVLSKLAQLHLEYQARERAVCVLRKTLQEECSTTTTPEAHPPPLKRNDLQQVLIDSLQKNSVKLQDIISFYSSVVPSDSRSVSLDPLKDALSSAALRVDVVSWTLLLHLQAFLRQTMFEQTERRQESSPSSLSVRMISLNADEAMNQDTLQDWLQAVTTCLSSSPEAFSSPSHCLEGDSPSMVQQLRRETAERARHQKRLHQGRLVRALADRTASQTRYGDAEREWDARVEEMKALQLELEQALAASLLEDSNSINNVPSSEHDERAVVRIVDAL